MEKGVKRGQEQKVLISLVKNWANGAAKTVSKFCCEPTTKAASQLGS